MVIMSSGLATVTKTDTITISVNVAELTMVDINPTSLSWAGIPPGGVGEDKAIQIENIGSTNITKIWFNNSFEPEYPYGSGNISKYNAGNFVVIKRNQNGAQYFFPNRVEYNESATEIYLSLPSNTIAHGRFRNSSYEYFWAITSNDYFYIGKTPHTKEQTGTVDFTGTCDGLTSTTGTNDCRAGPITRDADGWGYADVYIGGNTNYAPYAIAISPDNSTVYFYHWNMDLPGASVLSNPEYFTTSTLYPGGWIVANVSVFVSYGTPTGNLPQGILTVIAQSDANA